MESKLKRLTKKAFEDNCELQFYLLIEECAEVQKECTKLLRNKVNNYSNFIQELADLELAIKKFKIILNHRNIDWKDKWKNKQYRDLVIMEHKYG